MSTPVTLRVPSDARGTYLWAYNLVSAVLWAAVLGRVLLLVPLAGTRPVYEVTGDFTKWTQTLALVEVGHAAFGLVRSPLVTTVIQVASRILLVWGIGNQFPGLMAESHAYATMLLAWSATEVVRYSYFTMALMGGVPEWLTWLRYNLFYVLYPVGILSETRLIYLSIPAASASDKRFGYVSWAILATYVPGAYIMYTHMIAQRRRVIRGKGKARAA